MTVTYVKQEKMNNYAEYIIIIKIKLVSEWLLFKSKSVIVSLYHGENKLYFDEMLMMMLRD